MTPGARGRHSHLVQGARVGSCADRRPTSGGNDPEVVGEAGRDAAPPEGPAPVRASSSGRGAGTRVVVVAVVADGAAGVVLPALPSRSPSSESGVAVTVPVGSAPSGPVGRTIAPADSDPSGSAGITIGPIVRGAPG